MTVIIGIDPGSRCTGYGIIKTDGYRHQCITSGVIRLNAKHDIPSRLHAIHQQLSTILQQYNPAESAIERVFMHKNPNSALKLGQARGAALVALANHTIDIAEYAPRQIKLAVVGYGGADKHQVQHMIKLLLNLTEVPAEDAADALAIALCHAHCRMSYVNKLIEAT